MQEYSNNARVSHFLAVAEREYRDRDRGGHQRPRHRGEPLRSPTTRGRAAKPPGPAVAGSYARRVDGDDGGRVASALWESEVSSSTSSSQDEDEPLAPTSSPQDEGELATSTRRRSYIYLPKYCLYCLALFVVVPWVLIAVLFVQRHDVPSQNEAQSNREEVLLKGQNENATMVPSLTPLKIDNGSISVVCPPEWDAARTYTAGEWVGVAGAEVYSCKPHPYTGWCSGSENKVYEPGVGPNWQLAWDLMGYCGGATRPPSTSRPTRKPTPRSRASLLAEKPPSSGVTKKVFALLDAKSSLIDGTVLLYEGKTPSAVYRYKGFIAGLEIMVENGVADKYFYLGNDSENGHLYGLANIAAFLGQSMKETIQYDACDENNWDYLSKGALTVYPLSNACGQLGQSYQDYHCPAHQRHMECDPNPDMSIMGTTQAKWYGAPGPLFCGPKTQYPQAGIWDYTYNCDNPWADPPLTCSLYEGQRAGRYDNSAPVANRNGRTDVEGCCWWGRGVIQSTGICNFGKLNYYLGKRAADEGRSSRYPQLDFCQDPGVICSR